MSESQAVLVSLNEKLTREQLALVPTPPGTATHRPIPHAEVIGALINTLGSGILHRCAKSTPFPKTA